MTKYRYIKRFSTGWDFTLFWKISSPFFFILGIFLIGNAVMPVLSYQLLFSSKFKNEEIISPFVSDLNKNSFSLSSQVLGEETRGLESTSIRTWFPQAPLPTISPPKISTYYLSIPKLKIFQAIVKIGREDLNKNLIHYPGTAIPGKPGNAVIFGHSVLPQFFNPKNYLTIFSTLPTIKVGDEILIDYDEITYTYVVEELKEVLPNDVEILNQRYDDSYLTLVTCVPPGTYLRRLIVTARLTKK